MSWLKDSWLPSDFPFAAMTGPRDRRFEDEQYSIPEQVE